MSQAQEDGLRNGALAPALRPTPGTAQATLLNILGDIVHPARLPVPTAAMLEAMVRIGYSEPAIRQAILRCSSAGWIAKEKSGRSTRWTLTESGIALVEEGVSGVEQLSDAHSDWDGRWRIVIVTIPNEMRSVRDRLYRALRWDGFGSPLPSVWVSPHPARHRRPSSAITELGLTDFTLSFVGEADNVGLPVAEIVTRAWDLGGLDQHYTDLVDRFEMLKPATDVDHFVALLQLDQELQQLLVTDPHIPSSLTPHWHGREAAGRLLNLRREWHTPAEHHWNSIMKRHT
ncbi:PaaX family transcriptional regulator [Nocardia alni]|uniref:PaaX family transcriptional regulator n=1 Tax=Nocardia alni TaxID=2815723 RepID=UPI001C22FE74|nr:PaaX family transcriptional regulator C-terminal domain-containing protein [Nocardia alni]